MLTCKLGPSSATACSSSYFWLASSPSSSKCAVTIPRAFTYSPNRARQVLASRLGCVTGAGEYYHIHDDFYYGASMRLPRSRKLLSTRITLPRHGCPPSLHTATTWNRRSRNFALLTPEFRFGFSQPVTPLQPTEAYATLPLAGALPPLPLGRGRHHRD